jgi:predicted phage terminase large subunit-like protein
MLLGRGALQPVLHTYKVPNRYMNLELLTTDQLRDRVEKLSIEHIKLCQDNFLYFVQSVWPDFICRKEKDPKKWGHHQHIAFELTKISKGKGGRLIVNMPPRHTKSEFASYLFPAWYIGKFPKKKIMQVSHNAELSARFGSKVRNLIDSQEYKNIFGDVRLREDSKAKGRWETNHGGEYYAAGVGGSITGRGADLLIIDDPHTEQDAMSDSAMERAYEWYSSGPRQRLQPGGNILLVMTRWAQDDLTGRLLKSQSDIKADKWNIIEFPAILPTGASVWPEYWSLEELEKVKASISVRNWNAQYMQDPVAEEGAILKREWWQPWKGQVPSLKHVIQSYDTAFSKKESADYSAITTWGVFEPTPGDNCLILLDAEKGRWDFPELKAVALEAYKYWEPESVIVEAKASGQSLIQEMRRAGIPVMDFIPSRGKDKHSRVNACAPVFESGNVYYPDDAHFAEEVIEECAAFPFAQHDDYVDSTTQAVLRYRQGNFVGTYMDEPEPMKIEQDINIMADKKTQRPFTKQIGRNTFEVNPNKYDETGNLRKIRKSITRSSRSSLNGIEKSKR